MKKKPTIKQLTIYLDTELAEKLQQEAEEENRALAAMAREIIRDYFAAFKVPSAS